MKRLSELLTDGDVLVQGDESTLVPDFTADTRQLHAGGMFIAVRGTQTDGHLFIPKATGELGAACVVCERMPENPPPGVAFVLVKDSSIALAHIAARFFNCPASRLHVVGVTGTNGKTTTAGLLYDLFSRRGEKCGLISTVGSRIGDSEIPASLTTPDPKTLHSQFAQMLSAGARWCFMEVSSHAADQNRVHGIPFFGALFTNITRDHLDYHKTFANYIKAKKKFFDGLPPSAFALTNVDDKNGRVMTQNTAARVRTFALATPSDYKARVMEMRVDGMLLDINGIEAWYRLTGRFNAYNLTGIVAAAAECGMEIGEAVLSASVLAPIRGRLEVIPLPGDVYGVVDYAHTPDALRSVIDTLNELRPQNGRLITVVGCGGDRDPGKRPLMGEIAAQLSDIAIFTSDNPRSEDPARIMEEMYAGVSPSRRPHVEKMVDRREAINRALHLARTGDVILVAGKGHETYQEIGGRRLPFDDKSELLKVFAR
jgi:UDP-N-acetylmuramoyl-L-alanyl-D-glutamate--2,6-diaminopimelate ligase